MVAGVRADFRAKLSEDLAQHASFAHRLCKPTMPVPDCPADALRKLGESKEKWKGILQGGKQCDPLIPRLPSANLPVPVDFVAPVFQETSVELYRKACWNYSGKKSRSSDLWECKLLVALPDEVLFMLLLCLRLAQWRGY